MRRPAVALTLALLALAAPVSARDLASAIGAKLFQRNWVGAPASTKATDGLGPLYNARSCAGCHGGDGSGGAARVLRLQSTDGRPDPVYGVQIQDRRWRASRRRERSPLSSRQRGTARSSMPRSSLPDRRSIAEPS